MFRDIYILTRQTTGFFRDPRDYLHHVMKATNMSCLTPEGATSGECDFLSANMYARSLFGKFWSGVLAFLLLLKENLFFFCFFSGEDALANLSIERTEAGTITGHVRIRSKTQGIALSLGDRITMGMFFFSLYIGRLIIYITSPAQRDEKPLPV